MRRLAAPLTLPVTAAVGVGVALSLLLQLNQEAVDLKIVRLIPEADGRLVEAAVPRALGDRDVVILDVYGSLFYAGSKKRYRCSCPIRPVPRHRR